MKYYTSIILTLIGIIFSGTTIAQENYLPGYILNTHSDTLRGFIDYRNWERNPDFITFKKGTEDKEQYFVVSDINEFAVADEIYVRAIVDKIGYQNFSGIDQYSSQIKLVTDTVFLQTLVKGEKSLYYLKDKDGVEQFYIHVDTAFQLLKYKQYLKEDGGHVSIYKNKGYVGQLIFIMNDCAEIQQKTKDLDYNKTDLVKLFLAYHKCTNTEIQFQKEMERPGTDFGILVGFAHTSVEAKSSNNYLNDVPLDPSTNFSAGLFCNFNLPRNLGKWSIAEELLFTSYQTGGHYDDALNPATIEISVSQIKINNMLRYKIPVGKFIVFVNPGISFAIGVHSTNIRHDESIFHPPMDSPALNGFRSSEVGFLLGAGAGYKNFSLHLRYESSNGFSAFEDLATPTRRWYVLAGYMF